MQTVKSTHPSITPSLSATDYLRFKAKKLLKSAHSDAKSSSLPILRRLINSHVFRNVQLPDLYRHRQQIQRKHVLQLLALEAGFSDWAGLKSNYKDLSADQLALDPGRLFEFGYPNLWFRNHKEAREYVARHGGQLITQGLQAMVVPDKACAGKPQQ